MQDPIINPDLAVDLSDVKRSKSKRTRTKPMPQPDPKPSERKADWPLPLRGGKMKVAGKPRRLKSGMIVTGPRLPEERDAQKDREKARKKKNHVKHGRRMTSYKQRVAKGAAKRRKRAKVRKAHGA